MNAGTMKTFFTAMRSRKALLSAIRFHSCCDGGLCFAVNTFLAVLSIGPLKVKAIKPAHGCPISRSLCEKWGFQAGALTFARSRNIKGMLKRSPETDRESLLPRVKPQETRANASSCSV